MRESIGSTVLYNIIIVFLALIFALILSTLVYYKAFKVNKVIIASLEKFEGYNDLARDEIDRSLRSIGYPSRDAGNCPVKDGLTPEQPISQEFRYCIYFYDNDPTNRHYSYGVISYITFEIPFITTTFMSFPVYTKSDRIFRFPV